MLRKPTAIVTSLLLLSCLAPDVMAKSVKITPIKKPSIVASHHTMAYKRSLVKKYAEQYNVDEELVCAIIQVESGWNPSSKSSSGSIGMMQLTRGTARAMGVNPYNLEENVKGGIKYLAYLDKKFKGNEVLIIAAYNAGEGSVMRHKGIPPYKETRNYVKKVKRAKALL